MELSSGEQSLADKIAEGGHKPKAGQLLRVIDIPADAGWGFGLFDDPHGQQPGAFAKLLKDASDRFYGTAGLAFVDALAADPKQTAAAARVLSGQIRRRLLDLAP